MFVRVCVYGGERGGVYALFLSPTMSSDTESDVAADSDLEFSDDT